MFHVGNRKSDPSSNNNGVQSSASKARRRTDAGHMTRVQVLLYRWPNSPHKIHKVSKPARLQKAQTNNSHQISTKHEHYQCTETPYNTEETTRRRCCFSVQPHVELGKTTSKASSIRTRRTECSFLTTCPRPRVVTVFVYLTRKSLVSSNSMSNFVFEECHCVW
jgi:hypothetical protein